MPRYQFFLNHASDAREAGAVLSDSFAERSTPSPKRGT